MESGSRDEAEGVVSKPLRADAQRSVDALLQAAKEIFAVAGVDAPIRDIAAKAGVGVGTVYRRFPQRSDLIAAVFRREIDACAEAAVELAAGHEPLLASARAAGRIRSDIAASELLGAIARLSMAEGDEPVQAQRMVALLADGLRRSGEH